MVNNGVGNPLAADCRGSVVATKGVTSSNMSNVYSSDTNGLTVGNDVVVDVVRGVTRNQILEFERALSQVPGAVFGDSDLCPLKHSFAPGVYVREIFIPAGTFIVGKIHKHEHPNFLMSGRVSVVTESGGVEEFQAPMSMISPAGTKRVVYAHEDTTWITVHVTEETDLKKIEEHVIAPSFQAYEAFKLEGKKQGELP